MRLAAFPFTSRHARRPDPTIRSYRLRGFHEQRDNHDRSTIPANASENCRRGRRGRCRRRAEPAGFSPATRRHQPKIRLAWTEVAACHSPLGFGVAKGIYAKHNLDVELFYQGASGQTLIQALATGKADAGAGLIGDWLKPLEQGFDVKLFVGSHGGCQRLLASQASGIKDIAGVKGKTIATYGIGAPPQAAFQVTLYKAGIDPETDVTWKAVPFDLVGES